MILYVMIQWLYFSLYKQLKKRKCVQLAGSIVNGLVHEFDE